MSDIPSSSRPRSRTEEYEVDEEPDTSDDSSGDEIYPTYMVEFESNDSSEENFECYQTDNDEEETSSHSWGGSTASSEKSSESDCSEAEDPTKIPSTSTNEESTDDTSVSPIPVKVSVKPQPWDIDEKVDVVVKELINIDEHEKRLKDLQKELEFIKTTEWMYKPIDSYIY